MTTKEIAQAVGKNVTTVNRWIEKLLMQNASVGGQSAHVKSIRLKAGNKDPHSPADYTLEETCAIIEAGMGPDAAGIYRANAHQRTVTGAFLRALTTAYDKSLINREDWRRLAGLDPFPPKAGRQLDIPLLLDERTRGQATPKRLVGGGG